MFTGIIKNIAQIHDIQHDASYYRLVIHFPKNSIQNLEIGASVAINGCCLTVVHIKNQLVSFEVINETLEKTNIGSLKSKDYVHIERAACFGDEIGGHFISGHVFCTLAIIKKMNNQYGSTLFFPISKNIQSYLFHKGSIAIDGVSLTIGEVDKTFFSVHLIPETIEKTLLLKKHLSYMFNIEIDSQTQTIVESVQRWLMKNNLSPP